MVTHPDTLLEAIESGQTQKVSELVRDRLESGQDALKLHDSLFPIVQRVVNPPYINPHLPKMYNICRELFQYLDKDDIGHLVQLEATEYARRPKLEKIPRKTRTGPPPTFSDLEDAIQSRDVPKTALALTSLFNKDQHELARHLLLIGSGYLNESLGHSVSCTAFILQEMMSRPGQDTWPAAATLADYFCKGHFHETPTTRSLHGTSSMHVSEHLLRAASGRGIVNLHHTITLYAIERSRSFLSPADHNHMIATWIDFMGDKDLEPFNPDNMSTRNLGGYKEFIEAFSKLEIDPQVSHFRAALRNRAEREKLAKFLIKGVCDLYKGNYDPHYLSGLGSVLWVLQNYWEQPSICLTALHQYLTFFSPNGR